jgi:hypothetical protein
MVVFYITRRKFTAAPTKVDFADRLIAEPLPGLRSPIDPALAALFADVRTAGVAEGLTVFHAATDPALADNPDTLLNRLAALSAAHVLTALVIDPEIWLGNGNGANAAAVAVEQTVMSQRWNGPVLIPHLDAAAINLDEMIMTRGLPPWTVALPPTSDARVAALQRVFITARGRVLRASDEATPDAERVPLLNGVSGERT